MDEQQKFQKPWQISLLKFHARIDAVLSRIERMFGWLNPNNGIFQAELDRKPLQSVK